MMVLTSRNSVVPSRDRRRRDSHSFPRIPVDRDPAASTREPTSRSSTRTNEARPIAAGRRVLRRVAHHHVLKQTILRAVANLSMEYWKCNLLLPAPKRAEPPLWPSPAPTPR